MQPLFTAVMTHTAMKILSCHHQSYKAKKTDPTVVITGDGGDKSCSDLYYRCDIENGRAIWNSRHCQRNRVFSLTLGVCTNECEVADPSNECTTNGDDEMCSCFDDVGDLWTGPAGSTVQHLCSDYQDNWISKRYTAFFLSFHEFCFRAGKSKQTRRRFTTFPF